MDKQEFDRQREEAARDLEWTGKVTHQDLTDMAFGTYDLSQGSTQDWWESVNEIPLGDLMNQLMTDEEYQEKYGQAWEYQKENDLKAQQMSLLSPTEIIEQNKVAVAEQQAEKKHRETRVEKFRKYADHEVIKEQFKNLLGGNDKIARRYVESVVIAYAANDKLQACSMKSVMIAALQAASLGVSVDPAVQQAYLVPYNEDVKLIPDYRALVQMCVNTNYYRYAPETNAVYEGEEAHTNRYTGEVTITGEKVSDVTIGWLTYSEAKNGIKRWLYMSNEDCDKHAETYNPGGFKAKDSPWNNKGGANKDKMRRKTCLRTFIRRYGNFSPVQEQFFYSDEPVIEATFELPEDNTPDPEPEPELTSDERKARIEKNLKELGVK